MQEDLRGPSEAFFYDLRSAVQEDLRGLHVEVIRELEAQRHEMRVVLADEAREIYALRVENKSLRAQLEQMRGPVGAMGGRAVWIGDGAAGVPEGRLGEGRL